mmetsp:Transcript_89694/g.159368  ORF Transcript_89694/g.159368 Transcript_89694/m.159368 type:complete len:188 (+) Transcript_89694:23-586(+)
MLCLEMGTAMSPVLAEDLRMAPFGQPVRIGATALTNSMGDILPAAWHTSISIGVTELSFCPGGIVPARNWLSHKMLRNGSQEGPEVVIEIGQSTTSAVELVSALSGLFKTGSYDLLRKNCNTFTNVAMFWLTGMKLDDRFTALDRAGASIESSFGPLVQIFSFGSYVPNPEAVTFDLDEVLKRVDRF